MVTVEVLLVVFQTTREKLGVFLKKKRRLF